MQKTMNLFLNLGTIIPSLALMTGVLLPTNIAKAASYTPTNQASLQPEMVKHEEPTVELQKTRSIPQLFYSQKAQQIKLSIFLITIFLSIVVAELVSNPNKNSQSLKKREKNKNQWEQINKIEPNIVSLEVFRQNKKTSSLRAYTWKKFNNQAKIERGYYN